jgi:hypothetical protein
MELPDPSWFQALLACPSCRFDPDSPVTGAANLAILVMILLLALVGGGLGALVLRLSRAGKEAAESHVS